MARVRIFRRPKSAMQSGHAGTHVWVLEWEPTEPKQNDPMMGWLGSADTQAQVSLHFDSRDEAVSYAEREGLRYTVETAAASVTKPKSYAANFRVNRGSNWTH